jgi:hypothetical protein
MCLLCWNPIAHFCSFLRKYWVDWKRYEQVTLHDTYTIARVQFRCMIAFLQPFKVHVQSSQVTIKYNTFIKKRNWTWLCLHK